MAEARYVAQDLLRVPSLMSLARVPLAAVFPFVVRSPPVALGVIVVAGLTDLVDGWWARRFHQTTPIGAVADGIADKIFVAAVASTMLATGLLDGWSVLLLGVREIGELAIAGCAALRGAGPALHEEHRANSLGKATTAVQFAAVTLALFGHPGRTAAALAAGVVGLAAAWSYRRQAL